MPDLLRVARAVATNQVARLSPRGYLRLTGQTGRGDTLGESPEYIASYFQRCVDDYLAFAGVPAEDCVYRPDSTTVFSFPMKAPANGLLRDNLTAIEHLDLWLMYQRQWCEHKPSVTISVKEDEWLDVGAWVYRNFDEISGISFLPWADSSYRQMPYEECSEEAYTTLLAKMPVDIDWDKLVEEDDNVEGAQTLACAAGHCEI